MTHDGELSGNIIRDTWQGNYHNFKSFFNLHEQSNMEDFMFGLLGLAGVIMAGMVVVMIREEIVEMRKEISVLKQWKFVKVVIGSFFILGGGIFGWLTLGYLDCGEFVFQCETRGLGTGIYAGRALAIFWIIPAIATAVWFKDWVKANPKPEFDPKNETLYGADGRPRKIRKRDEQDE